MPTKKRGTRRALDRLPLPRVGSHDAAAMETRAARAGTPELGN